MKTFQEIIEAVTENHRINGYGWSAWGTFEDIEEAYGKMENENRDVIKKMVQAILDNDNGDEDETNANINTCLDCLRFITYGVTEGLGLHV